MAGVMRKPFRAETLWSLLANLQPSPGPAAIVVESAADANLARDAIAKGWLEFWYQPKVDLATGLTAGAEVLARIRHPERGIVTPASFLPGASDEDMMALTLRALESACTAADALLAQGRAMAFAVNIAGRIIAEPRLFNDIKTIRGRHASRLPIVLELTETDVLEDQALAQAFATRAILNGCQVSVDDFGHGYATFDRLRDMPFNELKLDRSIVKGCAADTAARALCRAGVEIARGFKARIVAEGVENAEDLAVVRSLGFDLAQGYFYSPPVPMEVFRRLPFDSLGTSGSAALKDAAPTPDH
jgi:EAL domain-containing protein (putative c-di-GMP-specific phosphodiesterase class I)